MLKVCFRRIMIKRKTILVKEGVWKYDFYLVVENGNNDDNNTQCKNPSPHFQSLKEIIVFLNFWFLPELPPTKIGREIKNR